MRFVSRGSGLKGQGGGIWACGINGQGIGIECFWFMSWVEEFKLQDFGA